LSDYRRYLEARDNSTDYIDSTLRRLMKITNDWKRLDQITADECLVRCRSFVSADGLCRSTANHYLRALKSFAAWLASRDRLGKNPLDALRGFRFKEGADRRRVRRALTFAELAALIRTAAAAPPRDRERIPGRDRAWLYTLAAYTGLRAAALASLTPESVSLDGQPPTITVKGMSQKNRRPHAVPLHPALLGSFRGWLATRPPSTPLWPGSWAKWGQSALMLRRDLEAAGIPYRDASGRLFDFHALRGQFITSLALRGAWRPGRVGGRQGAAPPPPSEQPKPPRPPIDEG
jgi:integrase